MADEYRVTDKQVVDRAAGEARAIVENLNASIEVAEPPTVRRTADGLRVMCWIPLPDDE